MSKDRDWLDRKKRLFPEGIHLTPDLGISIDQFVGRLRTLEDGMDPHAGERRVYGADYWNQMLPEDDVWRDQRDKELWLKYQSGRFTFDLDSLPTKGVGEDPWGRPPLNDRQKAIQKVLGSIMTEHERYGGGGSDE